MDPIRIQLAGLWIAVMLTYLLGDVLRIFSGDFKPGEIGGHQVTQIQWLGVAALMVVPIVMVVATLTLDQGIARWASLIAAGLFFVFNAIGLPTYVGAYDKFLIAVTLVFNVITAWYAWNWA